MYGASHLRKPKFNMSNSTENNIENLDFEGSIQQLEEIVANMEQGDIPLEDALAQFEQGIKLVRHSSEKLKLAEQRVQVLLEKNGESQLIDFETSSTISDE